jgi:signal transduction histidine kinase
MKETQAIEAKAIEEFCWSVIFELRQPMTAVRGHAQRAQHLMKTDPLRAHEALDIVLEQMSRMDNILVGLHERERRAATQDKLAGPVAIRPVREGVKT